MFTFIILCIISIEHHVAVYFMGILYLEIKETLFSYFLLFIQTLDIHRNDKHLRNLAFFIRLLNLPIICGLVFI